MRPDDPFPMDDKIKEGLAHFPLFSLPLWGPFLQSLAPFLTCRALLRHWAFLPVLLLLCLQWHQFSLVVSLCPLSIPAAYSHVVENTAFFGDVVLRFPRIVHHYYDRNSEWGGLLRWGLNFCNQTGVFTGGAHQHVLTLVRAHYSNLSCALAGPPPPCC